MKNLIIILVIFFIIGCFSIAPTVFAQSLNSNEITSLLKITKNHPFQLGNLKPGLNHQFYYIKTSYNKSDTTKQQSWWEPLFDINFWTKLSGPGPFVGLGFEYPVFKKNDMFALFVGASYSHSIDNKLQYYKTIQRDTSINPPIFATYDSCISCRESKAVEIFSLKVEVQYHWPKTIVDLFFNGGFHSFFGETFASFSRISGTIGAGIHVLKYIRLGLLLNAFKRFKPDNFGAVNSGDITNSIEFIPGATVNISLH